MARQILAAKAAACLRWLGGVTHPGGKGKFLQILGAGAISGSFFAPEHRICGSGVGRTE
jgi:hypothetical protein